MLLGKGAWNWGMNDETVDSKSKILFKMDVSRLDQRRRPCQQYQKAQRIEILQFSI